MAERTDREHLQQSLRQEHDLLATLQLADTNHDLRITGSEIAAVMVQSFNERYQRDAAAHQTNPRLDAPITPADLRQDIADAHSTSQATREQGLRNLELDFDVPKNPGALRAQLVAVVGDTAAFQQALRTSTQDKAAALAEQSADATERAHNRDQALSQIPAALRKAHPEIAAKINEIYSQDTTSQAISQIPPEQLKQHPELQALLNLQKGASASPAAGANDDLYRELVKMGQQLAQYKPENIASPTLENLTQAVNNQAAKASEHGGR